MVRLYLPSERTPNNLVHSCDPLSMALEGPRVLSWQKDALHLRMSTCHSRGTRLWQGGDRYAPASGVPSAQQRIILVSGCQKDETSAELPGPDGQTDGALTASILTIVQQTGGQLTYRSDLCPPLPLAGILRFAWQTGGQHSHRSGLCPGISTVVQQTGGQLAYSSGSTHLTHLRPFPQPFTLASMLVHRLVAGSPSCLHTLHLPPFFQAEILPICSRVAASSP